MSSFTFPARVRVIGGLTALLCGGIVGLEAAPAEAAPPRWAPAHGYRRKQAQKRTVTRYRRPSRTRAVSRTRRPVRRVSRTRQPSRTGALSRYRTRRVTTRNRTYNPYRTRYRHVADGYPGPRGDFDRDGIPNYRDRDMDGDGVRNSRDRYDYRRNRR